MHSPISTFFNHNTSDRSEMHRYKLSPRGKLYLKTDAEGKQKRLFYWSIFFVISCFFFCVIDVADVTLSCFFWCWLKWMEFDICYLKFYAKMFFFISLTFLCAQCSASNFNFFSVHYLNFLFKCCYGNQFVCVHSSDCWLDYFLVGKIILIYYGILLECGFLTFWWYSRCEASFTNDVPEKIEFLELQNYIQKKIIFGVSFNFRFRT